MKRILLIAIVAPLLVASCTPGPTYVASSPAPVVAQAPISDPSYYNDPYEQVYGPDGNQYAVVTMDGVRQYILWSYFTNWMSSGGYNTVYTNFHSPMYSSYFHVYSPSWRYRSISRSTYGTYIRTNNVRVSAPVVRTSTQTSGYRSGTTVVRSNTQTSGYRSPGYTRPTTTTTVRTTTQTSGFRSSTPISRPSTSGSGFRSSSSSSSSSSFRSSSSGFRSSSSSSSFRSSSSSSSRRR